MVTTALTILTTLLAAQGDNPWRKVSTADTGAVWSIRANDIANESEMNPVFWATADYSADRTVRVRSSKRRFAIDCAAATYQVLANLDYDPQGNVVDSTNEAANRYRHRPIAPETVSEDLAKAACPTGKYGG